MTNVRVERATAAHRAAWFAMRNTLWPDALDDDIDAILGDDESPVFVALSQETVVGFAEAALRHDYVNGCDTSPVVFLEGIYVDAAARRTGVTRALVAAVADWGRARGFSEFASDALLDNHASHAFHRAIGFDETERVVYFRQTL